MCLVGFLKTFFIKNENRKQSQDENNKISFSIEDGNLILGKMKTW